MAGAKQQAERKRDRDVLRIPASLSVQAMLAGDIERSGMSKTEMLSRLIAWYAAQDDVTRAAVLGTLPPTVEVDVAKMVLERLAGGGDRGKGKK